MPDQHQEPPVLRDQVRHEADAELLVPADPEKEERKRRARELVTLAATGAATAIASQLAAAVYKGQLL